MSSNRLHIPAALRPDRATATHWEVVLQQEARREQQIEECYDLQPSREIEGLMAYADVADQLVDDPMPAASRVPMMLTV